MRSLGHENLKQWSALVLLLLLTGFAIAGPTGLLAWRENAQVLEVRKGEIASLTEQRNALRNRVDLLDPEGADPDLVSELVREELGVVRPDEIIITLED